MTINPDAAVFSTVCHACGGPVPIAYCVQWCDQCMDLEWEFYKQFGLHNDRPVQRFLQLMVLFRVMAGR